VDAAWPVVLLVLRIGVVAVLYLFLLTALRALRAELRTPVLELAPAGRGRVEDRVEDDWPEAFEVETPDARQDETPLPPPLPAPVTAERRPRTRPVRPQRRRVPLALGIPVGAAAAVIVLGGALALMNLGPEERTPGGVAAAPANEPFGPPAVKPVPGRVTVGLAAQEDSLVRVTVDGVVQFDGTLRARQRQAWDGAQRVQVWTDKGKTVLIAINGEDLGPYSPAMRHPDWNRIDFGFIPGWTR